VTDSHYDQVMKKREESGSGPPRRYFAYSTILDKAAFEEWRQQHGYEFFTLPEGQKGAAIDVGLVYDFPSRWWNGRVAGLEDKAGQRVWGVVFEVAEKDWPIIQHKEGAVTGMCVEREVRVQLGDAVVSATAFVTNPARRSADGPISDRFLEALERGAKSAGLPDEYVKSLRATGL
jgi:cation transport regulator ChaC